MADSPDQGRPDGRGELGHRQGPWPFGHPRGEDRPAGLKDVDLEKLRRVGRWSPWILGLVLLWMLLDWGHSFYTDWLWFSSLGHEEVLLTTTVARLALWSLAVVAFLALALPNLWYAHRETRGPAALPEGLSPTQFLAARTLLVRAGTVVAVIVAFLLATPAAAAWETVLLFLHRVPFGEVDPIFGRDLGFFVFTLPALELLKDWLLSAVIAVLLITAAYHFLTGRLRSGPSAFDRSMRIQLAGLGAALFAVLAAGHWLGRYELMFSATGAVFGVGYTDDHVNLPGRLILALVALGCGASLLVAAVRSRRNSVLLWPVGIWIFASVLIGGVAPALFQRLGVEPSELAREREYLAHNIRHTRQGFGLDRVRTRDHPATGTVDAATVAANQGTIQNVRLWDERPLLQSYNQIQFFRLYYEFLQVHTDRYEVDGQLRQVMLATRELSPQRLPAEAQRWVNRHLQFTHGYGVAMSPVTEVQSEGRPSFLIRDVPPTGPIPLERPEVFYGLQSLDYVVTRSDMEEFNYPGPDGPVYTHYGGSGGVRASSLVRRLAYAVEFSDLNLLISGEIGDDSRIQYRRTVPERFSTLAPFLMRDQEAYSVVADGRLFWIQDAYTVTDHYPYSTAWGGRFNYIRNSVKAVIDAYEGSVDLYVFDEQDPLVQAYRGIFPELFRPAEEMPESLRDHVRYPLDLFTVQTQMLLQYHMQDPVVFYNKEDQWSVPMQTSFGRSQQLRPYYIVARLPDEPREEFLLIQPFTPNNRHNLVGWMAARSDGDAYGDLVLFRFPSGRHVDGPSQVEARIDNDAVISEQFTLWGQVGS
ncbi:MAG: UPF0182 family protein, partial [Gemmatimonadota bacterium]